jgi:putative DNA primase/helicase
VLIVGDVEDVDDEGRSFHRPWRLPNDCAVLERLLDDEQIAFLVVDGLGYSVTGDSHNYGAVGQALSALGGVAERTGCAILGLTHPPKGGSDPVTAAIGSTAWTAVCRVVWVLGHDPDDETGTRRVVRVAKSNFKMPDTGLAFTIGDDERWECGYLTGLSSSSVSAEDLVAASVPASDRTERDEARALVRSILSDGPMDTAELLKLTRAAGISDRTVARARQDLGVKAKPRHDPASGKMAGWAVELPTVPTSEPAPLPGTVGTVGTVVPTSSYSHSFSPERPQRPVRPSGQLVVDEDDF